MQKIHPSSHFEFCLLKNNVCVLFSFNGLLNEQLNILVLVYHLHNWIRCTKVVKVAFKFDYFQLLQFSNWPINY